MISRRNYLKLGLAAGGVIAAARWPAVWAQAAPGKLLTRAIPSSGEQLPVIGLGSSATFSSTAGGEDAQALREVLKVFFDNGGRVFDTAPSYGASEEVAGKIVQDLNATQKVFWATKLNVAGFGGGKADPAQARAQIDTSFARIGKPVIDLIQVHNLGDIAVQLPILKQLKAEKRVRYIGVTTTFPRQYEALEKLMREEALDFVGVDFAIDNRTMEERILPLAIDRGIGVLVYAPFGRTRLWSRVRGQEVPAWAKEAGMASWGQFFLKFVLAHPAVTCVTPATSRPRNLLDNLAAGTGELPDPKLRERMAEYVAALPG